MSDSNAKQVGLVGLYDDPDALVSAAEKVRDAGYAKWDCHTPYPVHGLDDAMGLKPSPVRQIPVLPCRFRSSRPRNSGLSPSCLT